jgi:hypothetical protein
MLPALDVTRDDPPPYAMRRRLSIQPLSSNTICFELNCRLSLPFVQFAFEQFRLPRP